MDADVVKAAIVAYCIQQLGGEVRIPRSLLSSLMNGEGHIYMTGDPVTNEYVFRTEQIIKGEESQEDKTQFEQKYKDEIDLRLGQVCEEKL